MDNNYNAEHYLDQTAKDACKRYERYQQRRRFELTFSRVSKFLERFGYRIIGNVSIFDESTGRIWNKRQMEKR